MPSRPDYTLSYPSGLRGRNLARLRERQGVGQRHLATVLGMTQPELSALERERYGGIPRGFSSRYRNAFDDLGECFKGCGCARD